MIFSLLFYLLFKKSYSHASRDFARTKEFFYILKVSIKIITKTAKYLCIYSVQYGFKQLLSVFHRDCKGRKQQTVCTEEYIVMNSEKGNCFISIIAETLRIFF